MKNIKSIIFKLLLPCCILAGFIACDDDMFEKELYKKVFSILSDDNRIFSIVHPFEEGGSKKNISVYCAGTNPIEEDVEIEIELDTDSLFNRYNEREFDLDSVNFAKILNPAFYTIESMKMTMKANQEDAYVKFPITILADSLSPDSTYFIPLRIKSVSGGYEINPNKRNMLYRPLLENEYAEQKNATTYTAKGTKYTYKTNGVTIDPTQREDYGVTKVMYPIGTNKVRVAFYQHSSLDNNGMASLLNIDRYSITLEVDENDSLKIYPYNEIESAYIIEMLPAEEYYDNTFRVENGRDCFFLNIRYRAVGSNRWYKIQERLRRD